MSCQLAIFDLDGTILNTLDDLTNAVNYAMGQCGLPELGRMAVREFLG
ncbi:MAG: HAD family hydrolase, partial [Eubacterium sp.]